MEFKNFTSVHAMLQATVERCRDRAAYRTIVDPVAGRTESVTWGEFDAENDLQASVVQRRSASTRPLRYSPP